MDPGKLEYYEFLDLSDIDENERQQLKQTLFSESTPDFLQLPWTNNNFVGEEWQKEEQYEDEPQHIPNGPLEPPALVDQNRGVQTVAQHLPAVTMYSQPPPSAYSMQPSSGYQHPQNVFVSNVTANVNVHGYMTGHYVQPHYALPEPPDMGRGHRGRGHRGRGSKRMDNAMVETTSAPGFNQQFVPIHPYHPAAYYSQAAQHATGSPLYIAPVYTPMYGAYHPGAQYYPPPVIEDAAPDMGLEHPPMYQEDYDVVATTVIVNSNMDPTGCNLKAPETPDNAVACSRNNVIPDEVKSAAPVICSVDIVKTETEPAAAPAGPPISILTNNNNYHNKPSTIVAETISETVVTLPPKVVQIMQKPVDPAPIIVNNSIQPHTEVNISVASDVIKPQPVQEYTSASAEPDPQESCPVQAAGKSWASLFNKGGREATTASDNHAKPVSHQKPLALVTPFPKLNEERQTDKTHDSFPVQRGTGRLGEYLSRYVLDYRTVSLQPRGLTNRSNYCYINSILQALLACPPFYNLLVALPHRPRRKNSGKPTTPILDSMVDFVNEFTPLSAESRLNRKEKGQRKDNIDIICGIPFEPSQIYKILNGIRTDTFVVEGRQEDAEEFFGCLLNGLNDEILELSKQNEEQKHQNLSNGDIATNGESYDQDDFEWTVMGPKNKGSITRRADFGRTPVSDIFRGQLRSRVHRMGDQITDNVQPFFTLQLDIEKASSVYEALELLVNKDKLEGVTCWKTNKQVEAWQQVTIEELPVVMVLHLKCFNYKLDACSKIIKALEFPIDLKIDSKLLSSKAKYTVKQKQYKLFAVVYHDGKEASKGHYLTDAYHVGYGGWVRYDDATVKSVQEAQVLHPNASRVPYLLYYRRCDTIGLQQNSKKE